MRRALTTTWPHRPEHEILWRRVEHVRQPSASNDSLPMSHLSVLLIDSFVTVALDRYAARLLERVRVSSVHEFAAIPTDPEVCTCSSPQYLS